jgi:hypothetical protein
MVTVSCLADPQKALRYQQKYNKKMQKAILLPRHPADLDQIHLIAYEQDNLAF